MKTTTEETGADNAIPANATTHRADADTASVVVRPEKEADGDDGVTPEAYPAVNLPFSAMKIAHEWLREQREQMTEYRNEGQDAKADALQADVAMQFFDAVVDQASLAIYGPTGGVCRSCGSVSLATAADVDDELIDWCCGSGFEWSRPLGEYLLTAGHRLGIVATATDTEYSS